MGGQEREYPHTQWEGRESRHLHGLILAKDLLEGKSTITGGEAPTHGSEAATAGQATGTSKPSCASAGHANAASATAAASS